MSTSTTGKTRSGTPEKLAELHEQIADGVAALVDSDAWRAMLEVAARFHAYSLGNVLLIALQAPQATRVAGFHAWKTLGRQVRKGERGIAILAPCTYRPKKDAVSGTAEAGGATGPASDATGTSDTSGGQGSAPTGKQIRGFRVVHVFDLAQTDGADLPAVAPAPLHGQAPAGLWDALAAQVGGHGYTLERGDCGRAGGYTDPAIRTVRVRADVDDAEAVLTLAHELAHIECGHVADLPTYTLCRGRCEIEAESVAYAVGVATGMDPSAASFAYVAGWAGGDVAKVRQCAETVSRAARTILSRLDDAGSADQSDDQGQAA